MYLLLDECCGKALAHKAEALGHTAQRSVDVHVLGRGASDPEVFDFARQAGAILVTVNRGDFIALAGQQPGHAGILLIPSVPNRLLLPMFERLLLTAGPLLETNPGLVVESDAAGAITSFSLP